MEWKDVGDAIANYADDLGDVVGMFVPGAALGGRLVSKITRAFGLGSDPAAVDPAALHEAIKADPEAMVKLQEIESKERMAIEEFKVQAMRIEAEERMSALRQVNETMRAEATAAAQVEVPEQFLWRPQFGRITAKCFAFAVVALCVCLMWAVYQGRIDIVEALPGVVTSLFVLFSIPGAFLGITTMGRNKLKLAREGMVPGPGALAQVLGSVLGREVDKPANTG
jgi:hypothetical protein